jgi:hypothetical protein
MHMTESLMRWAWQVLKDAASRTAYDQQLVGQAAMRQVAVSAEVGHNCLATLQACMGKPWHQMLAQLHPSLWLVTGRPG